MTGHTPERPADRPQARTRPAASIQQPGPGNFSLQLQRWEGPLPPPAILREYEELHPGFTASYLESWQTQSEHRQRMESALTASQIRTQDRGQHYALVLAITALLVALACALAGQPAVAIAVAGMDFGVFGAAFIVTRLGDRKDLARKRAVVPEPIADPRDGQG